MVTAVVALKNTRSVTGKVLSVEQLWVQELRAPRFTLVWIFRLHCALACEKRFFRAPGF